MTAARVPVLCPRLGAQALGNGRPWGRVVRAGSRRGRGGGQGGWGSGEPAIFSVFSHSSFLPPAAGAQGAASGEGHFSTVIGSLVA